MLVILHIMKKSRINLIENNEPIARYFISLLWVFLIITQI